MKLHINVSNVDSPRATAPENFVEMNAANDRLIMSNGSDVVADGEPIPSEQDLNQAAPIIDSYAPVIVPKYFLADASANLLREIFLAGNQNKRYVFCAEFDAATASEPVLQAWADSNLNTTDLYCLGDGTPSDSFIKAVTTTDALPGTDWTGSALAGASANHFLFLNNQAGALTSVKDLYFNLKVVIPAAFANAAAERPQFVIKYTTN